MSFSQLSLALPYYIEDRGMFKKSSGPQTPNWLMEVNLVGFFWSKKLSKLLPKGKLVYTKI